MTARPEMAFLFGRRKKDGKDSQEPPPQRPRPQQQPPMTEPPPQRPLPQQPQPMTEQQHFAAAAGGVHAGGAVE